MLAESRKVMRKIFLNTGLGIFFVIAGVAGLVQSINPTFLAQADAASLSVNKSATVMAILGSILFVFGMLIIILKVVKGRVNHGKERH